MLARSKKCLFHTEDRCEFLLHVGGVNSPHRVDIEQSGGPPDTPHMRRIDYVAGAVSVQERRQWPRLGLSITRRTLRGVARALTDGSTQCLVCFVCGEQRTTLTGPEHPDFEEVNLVPKQRRNIEYCSVAYFRSLERTHPHSLLNNCSYLLWRERYVAKDIREAEQAQRHGRQVKVAPLRDLQPQQGPRHVNSWNHISEWTLRAEVQCGHVVLFGCTEDVVCTDKTIH